MSDDALKSHARKLVSTMGMIQDDTQFLLDMAKRALDDRSTANDADNFLMASSFALERIERSSRYLENDNKILLEIHNGRQAT